MLIVRAYLNAVLVDRLASLLGAAGLDATTRDGTSTLIDDPITSALVAIGLPPADPSSPTDDDLSKIPSYQFMLFVHLAELRLRKTILAAILVRVTQAIGNDQANLSDMASGLRKDIAVMEAGTVGLRVGDTAWRVVPIDPPTAPAESPGLPAAWGMP